MKTIGNASKKPGGQPRTIYLQQTKAFIKITDDCGKLNNGLITIQKSKPVWLSLKLKDRSPSYLIGEIAAAGGSFCSEIGYRPSLAGNAICDGGTGYKGGIPFKNLGDALIYLAQYFNVRWCGEHKTMPNANRETPSKPDIAPPMVARPSAAVVYSGLLSCVAKALATFLSSQEPTKADFSRFYEAIKNCWQRNLKHVEGLKAHSESSWSSLPGVYVVHDMRAAELYDGVLYVGMTGKLTRATVQMSGKLKFRPRRWDPYSFQRRGFCYDYNRSSGSYGTTINAADYSVDCFEFDSLGLATPSFLEALMLQAYALSGPNRLPPANNAF